MFSKISVSVVLALAFFMAPMRLPAASCILSNAPNAKACAPACCANKTCCATSQESTTPPVQPLAKSSSDYQNIAIHFPTVALFVVSQTATASPVFHKPEWTAHSPAPLALNCIRLI